MSEKEKVKINDQETTPQASIGKKHQKRYSGENKKVTVPLNEQVTGPRTSRGKKQRRQQKIARAKGRQ